MELEELIAAVKAANDKAELEALVKTELELDLDKRKSLDTLRAEVLKGLGVEEGKGSGANGAGTEPGTAGDTGDRQQDQSSPDPAQGSGDTQGQHSAEQERELQLLRDENAELRDALAAEQEHSAQLRGQVSELQFNEQSRASISIGGGLTPPDLDDAGEQPAPVDVSGVRLLRNTENGRDFAWSPELAKLPNMKEL